MMIHHYTKIPPEIMASLSTIKEGLVAVGGAMMLDKNQLRPILKRLGIDWDISRNLTGNRINVIPNWRLGKVCLLNQQRRFSKKRCQHKIAVLKPIYGRVWSGSRKWQLRTYWMYPREVIEARRQSIEIFIASDNGSNVLVKYRLSELLNPSEDGFKRLLLESLNLAQESVGCCDVHPAEESWESYRSKIQVNWTILPKGTKQDEIWRMLTANGKLPNENVQEEFKDRYNFLMSFKGADIIVGIESFERYFGIRIREDLVVFDCLNYGNAMYIFLKDWEALSKKSRIELLSGYENEKFYRIAHQKDWDIKAKTLIEHLMAQQVTKKV